MKDTNTKIAIILGAFLISAISLYAGMHIGYKNMTRENGNFFMQSRRMGMNAQGMRARGMMGDGIQEKRMGRRTGGEITKIDGATITIKHADGTESTSTIVDTTNVYTLAKLTVKDMKVGQTIMLSPGGLFGENQTVLIKP